MDTEFSQLIRRYLKRRGMRRGELVRAMGLSHMSRGQKQLTRWLRGTAVPSADEAERVGEALKIPLTHIRAALAADGEEAPLGLESNVGSSGAYALSLHLGRGVDWPVQLPAGLSLDQALLLARARAKSMGSLASLRVPTGSTYLIDERGTVVQEKGRPSAMA